MKILGVNTLSHDSSICLMDHNGLMVSGSMRSQMNFLHPISKE